MLLAEIILWMKKCSTLRKFYLKKHKIYKKLERNSNTPIADSVGQTYSFFCFLCLLLISARHQDSGAPIGKI